MTTTTAARPAATAAAAMTATQRAAATPEGRDRTVDALRAIAIVVVVLGHWLMAALTRSPGGGVEVGNLLELEPWARRLTWPLQVMPLFFLVGGYAGAASWASAQRAGTTYGPWLAARLRRLLAPVAALVVVASAALAAGGRLLGADGALLHEASRLLGLPLWFLAVYVALVAATPLAVAADRRFGVRAVVALGIGSLLVDLLHRGAGLPLVGWAGFAAVWLLPNQLGVAWRRGSVVPSARLGRVVAVAGLAGLVVLTTWFGYGTSLVGAWGGERSNTDPPSLALVAATVLQVGLAWWARPALARLMARPRAWTAVVAANGVALTVFCWHLVAAIGAVALAAAGTFPLVEPGTAAWWLLRPLWLLLAAALLAPLVAAFSRVERRAALTPTAWSPPGPVALAAATASIAALVAIALQGLPH